MGIVVLRAYLPGKRKKTFNVLTLDVVCNLHGDIGVVQCLSKLADINLTVVSAVARVALGVALALTLCVALDVTWLSTFSLRTPWTLRPWRSRDGTTNTVTWDRNKSFTSAPTCALRNVVFIFVFVWDAKSSLVR